MNEISVENESVPTEIGIRDSEQTTFWGTIAPRGGRTVVQRILKDGAKVPLFLGQTLINSLRDLGYNSTTSALCEHVDNAIQWGASEVRVYFHQTGKPGDYRISTAVVDNGIGMAPNVLKMATAFGGSLVFENRKNIGRFGMGMKAAALSMSPAFDIYSWQEPCAIYKMTVDVNDIGNSRSNLIELPDPIFHDSLPSEVADVLVNPLVYPKNPYETQTLLASSKLELQERLGDSGTIVFMPDCDRLSRRKAQTLADQATKEMARIYRTYIEKGIRIFVNNRQLQAFDPTYWMETARHTQIEDLEPKRSKLLGSWAIEIPTQEDSSEMHKINVRVYSLPYEQWSNLPRKVLNNDLHVYEDHVVSFLRNGREVEIGASYPKLNIRKHGDFIWLRVEIDFPAELDEAFGVATNKQGVRVKDYVTKLISEKITGEIKTFREKIRKFQALRSSRKSGSTLGEAERRATDAENYQGKALPELTNDEQAAVEQNLKSMVRWVKREDESDEQALERIKSSRYVVVTRHDSYWPFYHCDFVYGKVVLTVNTAHPFFEKVWQPLVTLASSATAAEEVQDETNSTSQGANRDASEVLVGIQTLLLALARAESQFSGSDQDPGFQQMFKTLREEWSRNLATQLIAG